MIPLRLIDILVALGRAVLTVAGHIDPDREVSDLRRLIVLVRHLGAGHLEGIALRRCVRERQRQHGLIGLGCAADPIADDLSLLLCVCHCKRQTLFGLAERQRAVVAEREGSAAHGAAAAKTECDCDRAVRCIGRAIERRGVRSGHRQDQANQQQAGQQQRSQFFAHCISHPFLFGSLALCSANAL